jgi:hypothetical protein
LFPTSVLLKSISIGNNLEYSVRTIFKNINEKDYNIFEPSTIVIKENTVKWLMTPDKKSGTKE